MILVTNIEFSLTDESHAQINGNPKGRFILKSSAKYEHPNSTINTVGDILYEFEAV